MLIQRMQCFSFFLPSINFFLFIIPSDDDVDLDKSDTLKRKVVEEKRQREHILQLNQILAKQVMEKSKMVAGTSAISSIR